MNYARNKYGNHRVEVDGIKFDSKKEAERWLVLKDKERLGRICNLRRQVTYLLIPRQTRSDGKVERKCTYIADFVYTDVWKDKEIVEDVKSEITRKQPEYIIKRKLMLKVCGIEISEV